MNKHWRHLNTPLTFIDDAEDDTFTIYTDRFGNEVYLNSHGYELVAFDDLDVLAVWHFHRANDTGYDDYLDYLRSLTYEPDEADEVVFCADCAEPEPDEDHLYSTNSNHGDVCKACLENYYWCADCGERFREVTSTLHDESVCDRCRDRNYSWCDGCNGYYSDNTGCGGDHDDDDCDCYSPAIRFSIANAGEILSSDVRTTVSLPAGVISDEGVGSIANMLRAESCRVNDIDVASKMRVLANSLANIDPTWQTKRGNYTKRLGRYAHKEVGLGLPPEIISKVGNIGREHSQGVDLEVDVTRDLNSDPDYFANEGSCWWTDHHESRCALKTNGGFGLRSLQTNTWGTFANGRVWVLPLKQDSDGEWTPTFDTLKAEAFVVFNGYGDLEGYAGARVLAQMVGMTYRKISFTCEPMYINSEQGYFVSSEELMLTEGGLHLHVSEHANLFITENNTMMEVCHV